MQNTVAMQVNPLVLVGSSADAPSITLSFQLHFPAGAVGLERGASSLEVPARIHANEVKFEAGIGVQVSVKETLMIIKERKKYWFGIKMTVGL